MKKLLCCFLAVMIGLCMSACAGKDPLSEDQIAKLRERYPVKDLNNSTVGSMAVYYPYSMEQISQIAVDWVKVNCLMEDELISTSGMTGAEAGDPYIEAIENKTGSVIARTNVYHRFIMKVSESYAGTLKKGDTFTLLITDADMDITPDLRTGEFIMALMKPTHPTFQNAPDYYESIFDFMFYVTSNGYVLSVSGYENKEEYSGISVAAWAEKVKTLQPK